MKQYLQNGKSGIVLSALGLYGMFIFSKTKYICTVEGYNSLKYFGKEALSMNSYCINFLGFTYSYEVIFILLTLLILAGLLIIAFKGDSKIISLFERLRKSLNRIKIKPIKPKRSIRFYKKWKIVGLIVGLFFLILIAISYSKGGLFKTSDLGTVARVQVIASIAGILLRIFGAITCYSLSDVKLVPINKYFWGAVGLFFPSIALIISGLFPSKQS